LPAKRVWAQGHFHGLATISFVALAFLPSLGASFICLAMVYRGTYSLNEAHSLVLKLAAIMTALSIVAIVSTKLLFRETTLLRTVVLCDIFTGAVLAAYNHSECLMEKLVDSGKWKACVPAAVGDANAGFFYEYNWLNYLLFLTPAAMIAAAVLSWLACYRKAIGDETLDRDQPSSPLRNISCLAECSAQPGS
jgi:hypothetical protein